MSKEVTNNDIMQAILELSGQQEETSKEVRVLSQQQEGLANEVRVLSQQLTEVEKKLSYEINIVAEKIDLVSNRLLETEAVVSMLKRAE